MTVILTDKKLTGVIAENDLKGKTNALSFGSGITKEVTGGEYIVDCDVSDDFRDDAETWVQRSKVTTWY